LLDSLLQEIWIGNVMSKERDFEHVKL